MIKVISFKICPFFQQVMAVLVARNIPHDVEYADFDNCLFEISPNGKAPILVTETGDVLFDADAIISYLDLRFPVNSIETAESQATSKAWSLQASKNYVAQCSAMRAQTSESFKQLTGLFTKALGKAEVAKGSTRFFNGDQMGSVDLAWIPLLHRAALIEKHSGFDFFTDFPKLKTWQKAVLETDVVTASVSGDFETVFTDFYLSASSHLGRQKRAA